MNTDWNPITTEQLSKPSRNIILANILQKLQSGGHKILIFSQMVCVLEFLEDLLRIKHPKYERVDGLKSSLHQVGAIDWFYHISYQRIVIILRTRAGVIGLDLPPADTNIIFDNDWNPQLSMTLFPGFGQRR